MPLWTSGQVMRIQALKCSGCPGSQLGGLGRVKWQRVSATRFSSNSLADRIDGLSFGTSADGGSN
jgi:hypothetical protein